MDTVNGNPRDARRALVTLRDRGEKVDLIVCNHSSSTWNLWEYVRDDFAQLGGVQVIKPSGYYWPSFFKTSNLLNVINNAAVIAMIGIGMTMVIITGGIDLSVGSLVALAAFSGTIVLTFNTRPYVVPPFLMTLSMMMIARGLAYMISGNETIPAAELPAEFNWLGGGLSLIHISEPTRPY